MTRRRVGTYLTFAALILFFLVSLPTFDPRLFGFVRRVMGHELFTVLHEFAFPALLLAGLILLLPDAPRLGQLVASWPRVRRVSFWGLVAALFFVGIGGAFIALEKELGTRLFPYEARPILVLSLTLGVSLFYASFPAFFATSLKAARAVPATARRAMDEVSAK